VRDDAANLRVIGKDQRGKVLLQSLSHAAKKLTVDMVNTKDPGAIPFQFPPSARLTARVFAK